MTSSKAEQSRDGPDRGVAAARASEGRRYGNRALMGRMWLLAWKYRGDCLHILLLQSVLLVMALSGLGLTGLGVDVLKFSIDGKRLPQWPFGLQPPAQWSAMTQVIVIAVAVFAIAALRFVLDYRNTVALGRLVNQKIVVDLRAAVYDKLQRLSFRFFDAHETGSIINRVTGDVQAVRMFVDQVLIQVVLLAVSLTFFLAYMLSIHVWLTLACLATTPILIAVTIVFSRIVRPAYRINRELYDNMVRRLSENIQGVHVVKCFALQSQQLSSFGQANAAVREQKRWIFWRVATFGPLIQFIPQINLVVLLAYGGYLHVSDPTMTIGTLIVFAGLLQQFSTQVGNIAQISNSVQQSLIGAQRVFEVLDTPVEIESPPDAVALPAPRGRVTFESVSFGYKPGEPVLQDVSFDAAPGQCVAIVGATGAGKSTLLSLIPRFYDPQAGRILIDGVDARQLDLDDLRRSIGVVFQESFLFSNTVAANIAFGHPEATPQQIEQAARIAAAHEFIIDLPRGYDTVIGERGSNLSGGQRQRLAIARAVLLEPAILLMDDPTAAIDPETEHEILAAMDSAMQGRTTFIVAHRLSTLRRADLVLVLEQGRIVQRGTHEELMDAKGHYRRAASLQIADPESKRLLGLPT